MNHSDIVKDLLHKLSKNEFLAQDGGNFSNQRYYNKVNGYRNQLNGLYGGGPDEDKMTMEIISDIYSLIPISVLEEFVAKAEQQMSGLLAQKQQLEAEIAALQASGAQGDAAKNAEIQKLNDELQKVQAEMAALTAKLADTEQKLEEKEREITSLKTNIQNIRIKVNNVKTNAINSAPVKALLARLTGSTATATATAALPATATASSSSSSRASSRASSTTP